MQNILHTLFICLVFVSCQPQGENEPKVPELVLGVERMDQYLSLLQNRAVGMCVNHSSLVDNVHLVDTLLNLGINITKVYTPEHGFRGTADPGEKIEDEVTDNFHIVSLYGKNRKPTDDQLAGIEVMVFDIQDVGVRFYTYVGTMHYIMEACAENGIPVIVLDRPNPNGSYVDGPVLDTAFSSFVGMHPVPVIHGMTVGEYARMINGEGWLSKDLKCDLLVIPIQDWDHSQTYSLPVRPSPNLPNDLSIALYPSLCLFEGTVVSIGRGTDFPFQIYGHPSMEGNFSFTPTPGFGSRYPKLEGKECNGTSLASGPSSYRFTLQYILDAHQQIKSDTFFTPYFNLLAGNDKLKEQIISGLNEDEIRETWAPELEEYLLLREKYLLYP